MCVSLFRLVSCPALAIALAVCVAGPGSALAQSEASGAMKGKGQVRICLAEKGKPTDRCVPVDELALRAEPRALGGRSVADRIDLTFRLAAGDVERLRRFAASTGSGDDVEICIINGANICPPEPLEIVWVCITTGMLAGSECPEMPDTAAAGVQATVKLRSREWRSSWCRCLSRCGTPQFFVNVQADPLISEEGVMGSPEHCEAHAQIGCAAQNKVLVESACPAL